MEVHFILSNFHNNWHSTGAGRGSRLTFIFSLSLALILSRYQSMKDTMHLDMSIWTLFHILRWLVTDLTAAPLYIHAGSASSISVSIYLLYFSFWYFCKGNQQLQPAHHHLAACGTMRPSWGLWSCQAKCPIVIISNSLPRQTTDKGTIFPFKMFMLVGTKGGRGGEKVKFILFVSLQSGRNGRNIKRRSRTTINTWHLKYADSPGYFVWFIIVFWICGGPQVSTTNQKV